MVPAFLEVVPELPLLVSGKADRKRLPAPVSPLIDMSGAATAPTTALEKAIAAVWASILRLAKVGVDQNFFLDLGGHSLVAAQMTALLRSRCQTRCRGTRCLFVPDRARALAARRSEHRNGGGFEQHSFAGR